MAATKLVSIVHVNHAERHQRKMRSLMLDTATSDVEFIVGQEQKRFRCHRLLFGLASPCFKAMLFGGMLESRPEASINLPDIEPEVFELLREYIYCGTASITHDKVMELMATAQVHLMNDLVEACAAVVNEAMEVETVCNLLVAAEKYSIDSLKESCLDFIAKHSCDVFSTAPFAQLPVEVVTTLLARDDVHAWELDIFYAVQSWIAHDVSRKAHSAELLKHVRLPLISTEDLLSVVRDSNLVDDRRLLDAIGYHTCPQRFQPADPAQIQPRPPPLDQEPSLSSLVYSHCHPLITSSNQGLDLALGEDVDQCLSYVARTAGGFSSGRHYWEVTWVSGGGDYHSVGVVKADFDVSVARECYGLGTLPSGYAFHGFRRRKSHNGNFEPYGAWPWVKGETIGVLLEFGPDGGTLSFFHIDKQLRRRNMGVAFTNMKGTFYPAVELCCAGMTMVTRFPNFFNVP